MEETTAVSLSDSRILRLILQQVISKLEALQTPLQTRVTTTFGNKISVPSKMVVKCIASDLTVFFAMVVE